MERNWEAWFDYDEEGFIVQAGVDTAGRGAGVAETVCCTVESDNLEERNQIIKGDTLLMAAAPKLLAACKYVEQFLGNDYPDLTLKKRLQTAIAEAEPRQR